MDKRVVDLLRRKQYAQRTKEWYDVRISLVTASSAASLLTKNEKTCKSYVEQFGLTDIFDYNDKCCNPYSNKKQYYLEKCKKSAFKGNVATYWGQKYEPVVTDIYSKETKREVLEFGLLTDPDLHWLGASPDGITENGVMIEIKCPFRRKITGIPPLYYWIQVQLQLQVCRLKYCDFVEYEFVEFHTEDEFLDDSLHDFSVHNKGLFIQVDKTKDNCIPCDPSESQYVYPEKQFLDMPLDLIEWRDIQLKNLPNMIDPKYSDYIFKYRVVYWKAVNKSIVRIDRNQEWFESVKPELEKGHNNIVYYQKGDNFKELITEPTKKMMKGKTIVIELSEEEDNKCVFSESETEEL